MKDVVLAIDWGGTFVKLGLFRNNKIISKTSIPSKQASHPDKFLHILKEELSIFLKDKGISYNSLKSAGVGAPGMIDIKNQKIFYLPNIKGWKNYPFKKNFEKIFKIPVFIDNDANLMTLAELKFGNAKDINTAICITLGTGVGFGLVINSEVFRGRCSAGEGGHLTIDFKAGKCSCGSFGCIESFVGNERFVKSITKNNVKYPKDITPFLLYEMARKNDKFALSAWKHFGFLLGVYFSGLINIFNPEKIIIGGGMAGAFSYFLPSLRDTINKRAMYPMSKQVKIVRAKLRNDAGLLGANVLAQEGIGK